MSDVPSNRPLLQSASLVMLLWPASAEAHVKWFCGPIDGSVATVPLREVLTPLFLLALVTFTLLVAIGSMLDALLGRSIRETLVRPEPGAAICDIIVRLGLAVYAICLWRGVALVMWADPPNTAILTPDLYDTQRFVGYLQLMIALAVVVPRLSLVAAAGLLALYSLGVGKVGPVYMIDYLFFPGLAAYIALGDPRLAERRRLHQWRVPILIGSLSVSLMWTAIEKFLFPQWTIKVLLEHPGVTAGYPLPTVATIAGFVEFSLAFYLLAGREVLGRMGAVMLMTVFIAAMPEFGILDVVGHIPVLTILLVAVVTGGTPLQVAFRRSHSSIIPSGLAVSQAYLLVFMLITALYYLLHTVLM